MPPMKTRSPYPSSHQLTIGPHLEVMLHMLHTQRVVKMAGLILYRLRDSTGWNQWFMKEKEMKFG